jgi:hypothetical protein
VEPIRINELSIETKTFFFFFEGGSLYNWSRRKDS